MNTNRISVTSCGDVVALEKDYTTGTKCYTYNGQEVTQEEAGRILAEWREANREVELIL